ncbi:MAG: hypothetical protein U1E47_08495 [Rivihabitans pingtungensis]
MSGNRCCPANPHSSPARDHFHLELYPVLALIHLAGQGQQRQSGRGVSRGKASRTPEQPARRPQANKEATRLSRPSSLSERTIDTA